MATNRILVAGLAAVASITLAAQQANPPKDPQPTVIFRAQANYVEIDATVTDADGKPIDGLTLDDFEVREDGVLQKVVNFSAVDIPVERTERPLFASGSVEPDVQTNEGAGEGRIYLIVLDDLDTASGNGPRAKAVMRRFIDERFGANDLAAIVYTGHSNDNQDFTGNPRLLRAAIDKFAGSKLVSEAVAKLEEASMIGAVGPNSNVGITDPHEAERVSRARDVTMTVRRLADFMAGVRGRRKALLFVSEGIDYNIEKVPTSNSDERYQTRDARMSAYATSIRFEMQQAIAAATRGNVTLYAIDPRGLARNDDGMIALRGDPSNSMPDLNSRTILEEARVAQGSLRTLAQDTGGFAMVNSNDFDRGFDRIIAENSRYHMLGYYTVNNRRQGQFRKIEVRVKRPGARVRARSGYYEPRASDPAAKSDATANAAAVDADGATAAAGSPALAAAVASPLPATGLGLRVFTSISRGEGPNAKVAITLEVNASTMAFEEDGDSMREALSVICMATGGDRKVFVTRPQPVEFAISPLAYDQAIAGAFGVRAQTEMSLPPGRYQLRVAAENRTGRTGSVLYDLEVPDFSKAPLTMGSVELMSETELMGLDPDKAPEFLPTASREFGVGDTIVLRTEVYRGGSQGAKGAVDLRAELRVEGGRAVNGVTETWTSSDGAPTMKRFLPNLSLEDVVPGLYVVHVEARARSGDDVVSRDIQVRVK